MSSVLQQAKEVIQSLYNEVGSAGSRSESDEHAFRAILDWANTKCEMMLVTEELHDYPWTPPLDSDLNLSSAPLQHEGIAFVDEHDGWWIVMSRSDNALCWVRGRLNVEGWQSGRIDLSQTSTPNEIQLETIRMGEIFNSYATMEWVQYSNEDYWVAYVTNWLFGYFQTSE